MTWIQTYKGYRFDFVELMQGKDQPVDLEDIAHALSRKCRFSGHCREFVSVAEHSMAVANVARVLAKERGRDDLIHAVSQWGLLHDAAEAYLGDTHRPMKVMLRQSGVTTLDLIEKWIEDTILNAVSTPKFSLEVLDIVKEADTICLAWEKDNAFLTKCTTPWENMPPPRDEAKVNYMVPDEAEWAYYIECLRWDIIPPEAVQLRA